MELKQKLFTTTDVAQLLGLTHGRISQIARDEENPIGTMMGNTRIFTEEEVEKIRSREDGRKKSKIEA